MNRALSRSLKYALSALLGALAGVAAFAANAAAEEIYATVERTVAPGERAVVKVRAAKGAPVTVVTYRIEDPTAFLDAAGDLTNGPALHARLLPAIAKAAEASEGKVKPLPAGGAVPGLDPAPKPIDVRLTFVSTTTVGLQDSPDGTASREVDVALPSSGLYGIEVRRGDVGALVTALSSRLALVVKRDASGALAWAVDRATGKPLAGVEVEARAVGKAAGALTDADGIARFPVRGGPTVDVRARLGDDFAFGNDTYFPANVEDRGVYAFPHQPAYRPGERVEVKGIVRAWRDGRYALDAEAREATVALVAPGDREIAKTTAAVSADLGTFAAGFDLGKDAPLGDWTVRVDVLGKGYAAPLRVEEYRKPTFEVGVEATPSRVFAGGDVSFDVAASFFEGGPVAGGQLRWTLAYHRVDRDLFPTDELARLFFGTEREAYAPVALGQGEAILDAAGRAKVAAKAPPVADDGYLTLAATVIGPDRTAVGGSGTAAVSASPLSVAVRTDKHLYGPEATARVTVRAVLADGSPAKGREGVLLVTQSVEGPTGLPEERATKTTPFTTDERGAAVLDATFPSNGRYAISATLPRIASEPAGAPAAATVHAWVAGEHADIGFSGDHVEIVADKDAYAVGDVARLLVLAPVGARPFLSTVEGARLSSWKTTDLGGKPDRGAGSVIEMTIDADHSPNTYVGVALVDQGNLLAASKLLRVPPVERLLKPVVTSAKTELDPGETIPMTVSVTDLAGKPAVGAEVAIAVVDDALYALYSDPAAPLEPFFHPVRRNDVTTGGPLHHESVGWFAGMTAEEVRVARLADAARPGEGGGGGPGFGGPPGAVPVPSPAMPPPSSPAAEPSTGGAPAREGGELPGSTRAALRQGERARGDVPESEADEEKKEMKDGGEGPLAARADFRSAVWWSPAVRVGEDGTAAFGPVKFAESLTRWRITARAVDAATRVGTSVTTVRTTKKVLTRVTLPRFLRATDTVEAPWLVHNLTTNDVDATGVLSATGLTVAGSPQVAGTVKAGAVSTRDVRLTAPAVGEATVTAEVRSPAGSDALRLSIPVLPQGIPKTLAATGFAEPSGATLPPLSLPSGADPRTARLTVTVAPSVAQAVGAALPYLLDYPYGCTEQTMSRMVPAVVAKTATDSFKVPLTGRLSELPKMLDAGISRLAALQHQDGGFGWWPTDASDPYMTAYVLHGLTRAMAVMPDPSTAKPMADKAAQWLLASLAKRPLTDAYAMGIMALADHGQLPPAALPPAVDDGVVVVPTLARAFLLRAAAAMKRGNDVQVHLRNLVNRFQPTPFAAFVPGEPNASGRWNGDSVETTAWALGSVLLADPRHPILPLGVRWLLKQRANGAHWQSTRDTAACVAFLTRYAAATGDLGAGKTVRLSLNGQSLGPVTITAENAFTDAAVVTIPWDALPKAPLELRAEPESGSAAITAALSFTETGPAIDDAAAGFSVKRTWYRFVWDKAANGHSLGHTTPWTESVPTGTLVEAEIVVTTTEKRDFVMVTSPHPAGFEPEKRAFASGPGPSGPSGIHNDPARTDHVEVRDDRTVFFVKDLPAGTSVFRHVMRATHVGAFTALPAQAELMYFPQVRGNSKGEVIEVSKGGEAGTPGAPEGGK